MKKNQVVPAEYQPITLDMAKKIFTYSNIKKELNLKSENEYSKVISASKWYSNQIIVIDVNGEVVYGRHFLEKIVKSGIPVWVTVIRNAPEGLFLKENKSGTKHG